MKNVFTSMLLVFSIGISSAQNIQQVAAIGDLKLTSGNVIKDCKVGYRIHGKLNAEKSNLIVYLTWFRGTAASVEWVKPWQAVDTTRFCLIIIDALGDGVSSSPSNSISQHGINFPQFSVSDMVESQHELLTKKLGITHVQAVMGVSMGGIQTFQWSVKYPDFMDKLIPIVGSPRPTSYDLMFFNTFKKIIEADSAYNHGHYTVNPIIAPANMLGDLMLTTPADRVRTASRQDVAKWAISNETNKSGDWNDCYYQCRALMTQDVSIPFNGSMEEAAKHVKAKMLIITSAQDHTVNPAPAIDFSRLVSAKLVILNSERGHLAPDYADPQVKDAVMQFLNGN